jgi:hypothetical protein
MSKNMRNLEYKQKTPNFIQKLIDISGYQPEEERVQDKFRNSEDDDDEDDGRQRPDFDDEQPVVVDKKGREIRVETLKSAPPTHERFKEAPKVTAEGAISAIVQI